MRSDDDVRVILARVEEKLDGVSTRLDEGLRDHEERIRAVERFQWLGTGVSSVLGAAAGLLGAH